jgi:membrane protease YdiL (CAAX protease family)
VSARLRQDVLRLACSLLTILAAAVGAGRAVFALTTDPNAPISFAVYVVGVVLAVQATYRLEVSLMEHRRADEVGVDGAAVGLLGGVGVSLLLAGLAFAGLWLVGVYRVDALRPAKLMMVPFFAAILAAYLEELSVRGVVFRHLESWVGTWGALGLTAGLFGLLHLRNPHATWAGAVSIALTGGLVLGLAFAITRRIWFGLGIHAGWNFLQGGVFGGPVSGVAGTSLLAGTWNGPAWLSGGAFGAEASVVTVVVGLAIALALIYRLRQTGQVRSPIWSTAEAPSSPVRPED